MGINYRIRLENNSDFIINNFACGNNEVEEILTSKFQLHFEPEDLSHIFYLFILGITGDQFLILWNECCNKNKEKLFETIDFFKKQTLSSEQILLLLESPKPFI